VSIADSASLDITDAITVSVWAFIDPLAMDDDIGHIVTKNDGSLGEGGWQLTFDDRAAQSDTNAMNFFIGAAGDEFIVIEEENAISEARWYYLVGTYDKDAGGTVEVKLYRDGVQVVTGDFSSAINLNNIPVRISGLSDSDALFTGKYRHPSLVDQ